MALKKGDIVRYGGGSTALMRLTTHEHGRWYGEQYFGGGASEQMFYPLKLANHKERRAFRREEKLRHKRVASSIKLEIKGLQKQLKELRP